MQLQNVQYNVGTNYSRTFFYMGSILNMKKIANFYN